MRRVAIDKVRPDANGEIEIDEGYADDEDDLDKARFEKKETPVIEMAGD